MSATPCAPIVSIIVPVLNEAAGLQSFLAPLQAWRAAGHQVILVDGGSTDGTPTLAGAAVDCVVAAPAGRALQMNAGAAVSKGALLLFLHADTRLPTDALTLLAPLPASAWRGWGRFDVRLSGTSWLLRIVEQLMNLRSRLSGIATGDQGMFVSRALFEACGGFAPMPLMEDIELSRRLRRIVAPMCLRAKVITSSRRWEQEGIVRTIVRMWWLRWQYFRGADPALLATRYHAVRGP